MSETVVPIPKRLDLGNVEAFFKRVSGSFKSIQQADTVVFDFTSCKYASPTGAATLLSLRDRLHDAGIKTKARLRKKRRVFRALQAFGLFPIESDVENAYRRRLAEHAVPVERCLSSSDCLDVQDKIMRQIVNRTDCVDGTKAAIDYMINEIWDNAGVHGYECYDVREYPKPVYIGGFSYRTHVEVVVADRGQGIHSSLRKNNADYQNRNAKESLKLSLEEEESGHPEGSPGFGLYSAAQFVLENNGSLSIWSSGRSVQIDEYGNRKTYGSELRRGTMVAFRLNSDLKTPFEQVVSTAQSAEQYLELIQEA